MAYDAGQQNRARRHMLDSLRLSHTAYGRSPFGGRVLTALSHQALHLGRLSEALDLARAAREGTSGMAAPAVTAMFASMEACALAAIGDHKQCESTLAAAETALNGKTDGVGARWLDFDEGGLWGHAARAYRDLGQHHRARRGGRHQVVPTRSQSYPCAAHRDPRERTRAARRVRGGGRSWATGSGRRMAAALLSRPARGERTADSGGFGQWLVELCRTGSRAARGKLWILVTGTVSG